MPCPGNPNMQETATAFKRRGVIPQNQTVGGMLAIKKDDCVEFFCFAFVKGHDTAASTWTITISHSVLDKTPAEYLRRASIGLSVSKELLQRRMRAASQTQG